MNDTHPFRGFHERHELPVRDGDIVLIPKGATVTRRGERTAAKCAHRVRVDHVLPGMSCCVGRVFGDSEFYLGYTGSHDRATIKALYGTEDLSRLWPLMKVSDGYIYLPVHNPEVRWAGRGGYWASVDINDLKLHTENA